MPPVTPVPTLFDTTLKFYGRLCISGLINKVYWLLRNVRNEEAKARLLQRRELLLKEARKYALQYTVLPATRELLKFAINDIFKWISNKMYYMDIPILLGYEDFKLWKVLIDFIIIHGNERISDLDFGIESKGPWTKEFEIIPDQVEEILSKTVFQNELWSNNLVSIKLPHLCNSGIVKALGCHCNNLEHLDMTSSYWWRTSDGNKDLACLTYLYGACGNLNVGCPKLKTIFLPMGSKTERSLVVDHVIKMIQFMPDLQVIRNVDTRVVAINYKKVVGGNLCSMKLTEFEEWDKESCKGKEFDTVNEALGKIFPSVKRYASYSGLRAGEYVLSIPCCDRGLLDIQKNFPCLQVIEVHEDFSDMLKDMDILNPMPSVKVFELYEAINNMNTSKIQVLSAKFPNLEKLTLNCNKYCANANDVILEDTLFLHLNKLELNRVGDQMDVEFLQMFFKRCPSLVKLDIFCTDQVIVNDQLTDRFVEQLSAYMGNLERLNITQDARFDTMDNQFIRLDLTYTSLECILSSCPNLKFLGDVYFWSVTKYHVEEIKEMITENNWNLDIFYSFPDLLSECGSTDNSEHDSSGISYDDDDDDDNNDDEFVDGN